MNTCLICGLPVKWEDVMSSSHGEFVAWVADTCGPDALHEWDQAVHAGLICAECANGPHLAENYFVRGLRERRALEAALEDPNAEWVSALPREDQLLVEKLTSPF